MAQNELYTAAMQSRLIASDQLRNLSWQHHQAETGQEKQNGNT